MAARGRYLPVVQDLRRYVGTARRVIATEMVLILRQTNPFKTGHSRNNWVAQMGHPYRGVDGSRMRPSDAAQRRGLEELAAEPPSSRRVANVSNNVPYVPRLNEGSSEQAGAGYVEAAEAQALVNARLQMGRLRRARR